VYEIPLVPVLVPLLVPALVPLPAPPEFRRKLASRAAGFFEVSRMLGSRRMQDVKMSANMGISGTKNL